MIEIRSILNINELFSLNYFMFWFASNPILVSHFTFNIIYTNQYIYIYYDAARVSFTMSHYHRSSTGFPRFFYTFVFFISVFSPVFNLICICVSSYYNINVIMLYVRIEYVGYVCITPLSCA